jgi:hypothetical protein
MDKSINYLENKEIKKRISSLKSQKSKLQEKDYDEIRISRNKHDEEASNKAKNNRSIYDRIAQEAASQEDTIYVEYKDAKEVKKSKREHLKNSEEKSEKEISSYKNTGGRPRKPEEMKSKKFSISFAPNLNEIVESKMGTMSYKKDKEGVLTKDKNGNYLKDYERPRSLVVGELLEKSLTFEKLRFQQAAKLKVFLNEYAKEFEKLRIRQKNSSYSTVEIPLKENIKELGTLFLLSKRHKQMIEFSGIEFDLNNHRITDTEILKHLSDSQITNLEFALNPMNVVSKVVDNNTNLLEGEL